MTASTVDLNWLREQAGGDVDPLWDDTPSHWLTAVGMCVALATVLVILLAVRLSRLDPHRKVRK